MPPPIPMPVAHGVVYRAQAEIHDLIAKETSLTSIDEQVRARQRAVDLHLALAQRQEGPGSNLLSQMEIERLRGRALKLLNRTSSLKRRHEDTRSRINRGVNDADVDVLHRVLRRRRFEEQHRLATNGSSSTSCPDFGDVTVATPTVHQACSTTGSQGRRWWDDSSPSTSSLRISVLTMVKGAVTLLRDWVPYHLLAGVAHIYLVNNDCGAAAEEYGRCSGLRPYMDAGAVTLIDTVFRCRQVGRANVMGALSEQLIRVIYGDVSGPAGAARARVAAERQWILQIDPDEYVVLPPHARAAEYFGRLLRLHSAADAVNLPWRVFGTSFRANNTRHGSIIANYRLRLPLALTLQGMTQLVDRQKSFDQINPFLGKEIVRVAALGNRSRCADASAAHEHACSIGFEWVTHEAHIETDGSRVPRLAPVRAAIAEVFIHHYTFLSDKDWVNKKERGRPRRGSKFSRRRGGVDELFSAVYDATLLDRVRLLAHSAVSWSAEPALARRCAASLQRGDSHFEGHAAVVSESIGVGQSASPLALARAAWEAARARHATQAKEPAALWFVQHWSESGHSKSTLPLELARDLGAVPNETASEQAAAHWLANRWTSDARVRRVTTDAITEAVEGFAKACRGETPGVAHGVAEENIPTRTCAGWTDLHREQI